MITTMTTMNRARVITRTRSAKTKIINGPVCRRRRRTVVERFRRRDGTAHGT